MMALNQSVDLDNLASVRWAITLHKSVCNLCAFALLSEHLTLVVHLSRSLR